MEPYAPFRPAGPMTAVPSAPGSAVSAALLGSGLSGDVSVTIYVQGAQDVAIGFGPTSTSAVAAAVFPTPFISGGPSTIVIKGNTEHTLTQNSSSFLFAAAASQLGSSTVFMQAGYGFGG